MSPFAKPPSPALVLATIALIVAIGGGAAIAASKIQTSDIAKQAVTNKKIAKKTIKATGWPTTHSAARRSTRAS